MGVGEVWMGSKPGCVFAIIVTCGLVRGFNWLDGWFVLVGFVLV